MTKREYIVFYLVNTICLRGNDRVEYYVNEKINQFPDDDISRFYEAISVRLNNKEEICLLLDKLYESVFSKDVIELLTPSQAACLWQGRFRFGEVCGGYVERDNYKDELLCAGEFIYALVPDNYANIPNYFFDKKTFQEIKGKTTMDAYAKLQINPYWSKGFGARRFINEYMVTRDLEVAVAYAHSNHHLSREMYSSEILSEEQKKESGIGNQHVMIDPYDEYHTEYEYVVPPSKQIFVPEKSKGLLKVKQIKIQELVDDMTRDYERLYRESIIKAQEKLLERMRGIYEINKRHNDLP